MSDQNTNQQQGSIWADERSAHYLSLREKTFYNSDYFERVVMPLLDLPQSARVLDVGCGNGGLSFSLANIRPDLRITGVDPEESSLERASKIAAENGWVNLSFEKGDGHQLNFEDGSFDAVLCQTVLTHVQDAQKVVHEMARVLKPGGVFFAAEYTDPGAPSFYSSVGDEKRDEAWVQEYFRLSRLYLQGKKKMGLGDDLLGERIPVLATDAGLNVFDVRLNDRVMHVIPPYRHSKQADYLELLEAYFVPDSEGKGLARFIDIITAAGGTEEEAIWLYNSEDDAAVLQAIKERNLMRVSAYMLYLTFARKPYS